MAHEIETYGSQAAFFSARQSAWHQLGTVTTEAQTAQDALEIAHLDWEVELHPLTCPVLTEDGVTTLTVPGRFATVRRNPFTDQLEVLGDVGKDYTVVQNRDNTDFLDAIVGQSGAHYETAGSLRGGRQVFITMKAPETMMIGGVDAVDYYLVATNSHDGTTAFRVVATPTRVVCANTLRMGLANAKASFSTRHTRYAKDRVAEAQEALGVMWNYAELFKAEAEKMADQDMVDSEFEQIVSGLFVPKGKVTERTEREAAERREAVQKLYHTSKTLDGIRGTRWGGYNAVTEYIDWLYPVRGDETARAERIAVGGWVDKAKQEALVAFR